MKKTCAVLIIAITLLFLCSCDMASPYLGQDHIRISGIEEYPSNLSNFELHVHLLPTDGFIDRFKHTDAEYHFAQDYDGFWDITGKERLVLALTYEESIYKQAKAYCFQNMQLDETNMLEYGGHIFIENIKLAVGQDRYGDGKLNGYPRFFQMFAYNDVTHSLVFIGFYDSEYTSQDADVVSSQWEKFLQENFLELYSFD